MLGELRLLTTLHYSVPETLGDIQTMVETTTRENYIENNNIQRTANIFDANRLDENSIVQVLEESYSLLLDYFLTLIMLNNKLILNVCFR